MTVLEYELREKDLVAFNEHQLRNSKDAQRAMKKYRYYMPAFLILSGFFFMWFYGEYYSGLYVIALALLFILMVPKVLFWDFRRKVLKMYSEQDKEKLLGKYRLRIEPRALHEEAPSGRSKVTWDEVLRVELEKHYAFIFTDLDSALIIPKETVSNGDIHEFVSRVDEYLEQAE